VEPINYYSNGKLMISGEYLVLKGSVALAVPLKLGQRMTVNYLREQKGRIYWKAWFRDKLVFESDIDYPRFTVQKSNSGIMSERLVQMLISARNLNSSFLSGCDSLEVTTVADFDLEWGLGSSSSLISNIAYWSDVDPFKLNSSIFNGSGYDIACARASKPILYSIKNGVPSIDEVDFFPAYADKLYFVYLGNKQDTQQSLKLNGSRLNEITEHEIHVVSEISKHLLSARDIDEFEVYMLNHEKILGDILGMMPIKYRSFPDFAGEVKSLGAWGGDFVLVSWKADKESLLNYFSLKGYSLIYPFKEFIKDS
jgi:mevalonate kinase